MTSQADAACSTCEIRQIARNNFFPKIDSEWLWHNFWPIEVDDLGEIVELEFRKNIRFRAPVYFVCFFSFFFLFFLFFFFHDASFELVSSLTWRPLSVWYTASNQLLLCGQDNAYYFSHQLLLQNCDIVGIVWEYIRIPFFFLILFTDSIRMAEDGF